MEFPVFVRLGPLTLHPHPIFEALAYFVGFRLYLHLRRRRGDPISTHDRWTVIAGAIAGAAIGSRVLYWMEDPAATIARWNDLAYLLGGKTVVGGLLGGLFGVELAKALGGITTRTGDLFALPLTVGIATGRIGCFLSGVGDATWGAPTAVAWGIDGGDGVLRHPTPLYEIVFLAGVAVWLADRSRRPRPAGDLFRDFMVAYLAGRLALDALKPEPDLFGLSAIQWACVAGIVYFACRRPAPDHDRVIAGGEAHIAADAARSGASRVRSSSSR